MIPATFRFPCFQSQSIRSRSRPTGFGPAEQRDVRLQVDEHRELNFTLQPASVNSTVEVNATEIAVQTTNPTLGQVITSDTSRGASFEWT